MLSSIRSCLNIAIAIAAIWSIAIGSATAKMYTRGLDIGLQPIIPNIPLKAHRSAI